MAKINMILEGAKVPSDGGQGASEGKLEVRISGTCGGSTTNWPNATGWEQMSVGGAKAAIEKRISSFTVDAGETLSKSVNIEVVEVDGGLNGQDDEGSATITFDLSAGMAATTKSADVRLYRPNGGQKGEVRVYIRAEQV